MSGLQHYGAAPIAIMPMPIRPLAPPRGTALDRIATTLHSARGEVICHDGDIADACFRVVSGCVRLSKTLSDGRRHVVGFMFADSFFGLGAADEYDYTAEAIAPTVLVRFPHRQLEALAERDIETCNLLRRATVAALAASQVRSILLARLSAEERLAAFLLDLAARMGVSRRLPLPMTRADIGDYLGLTIETVSRTFTKFRARGWISLGCSQDVTLLNPDRLAELSEGGLSLAA